MESIRLKYAKVSNKYNKRQNTKSSNYKKPKQKVSIRAREKSDILALLVPKKIKLNGEGLIK